MIWIWQELKAERHNPELSALRRLEALWGRIPGDLNPTELAAQFWRFLWAVSARGSGQDKSEGVTVTTP